MAIEDYDEDVDLVRNLRAIEITSRFHTVATAAANRIEQLHSACDLRDTFLGDRGMWRDFLSQLPK